MDDYHRGNNAEQKTSDPKEHVIRTHFTYLKHARNNHSESIVLKPGY